MAESPPPSHRNIFPAARVPGLSGEITSLSSSVALSRMKMKREVPIAASKKDHSRLLKLESAEAEVQTVDITGKYGHHAHM